MSDEHVPADLNRLVLDRGPHDGKTLTLSVEGEPLTVSLPVQRGSTVAEYARTGTIDAEGRSVYRFVGEQRKP